MGDLINSLLTKRLSKNENTNKDSTKMATMAKRSAQGNLSGFSGVFSVSELSENEKSSLEELLTEYDSGAVNLSTDLESLISITSEVKAINNQAAILHGERIKKAQTIFKQYKDGAFTAWLIATYGNRQTPYNFLQYYEFYDLLPKPLRPQIESMPRQAIYTLASRDGPLAKKQRLVENYQGETKAEVLSMIREIFPLPEQDQRQSNPAYTAIQSMERACKALSSKSLKLKKGQKRVLNDLLINLDELINP